MRLVVFTIYCHTCIPSGKKYVGQTMWTVAQRWRKHVNDARSNRGCRVIGAAIRKWGSDCWTHEVLETVALKIEADVAETKWIAQLGTISPNGYNIDSGGTRPRRPDLGEKLRVAYADKPEEWKAKNVSLLRAAYSRWLASTTLEQRRQTGIDAWKGITPEERSKIAIRGKAGMTPEARKAAALKGAAKITLEERRAVRRKQIEASTHEQRSASARKGAASLTPEQLERRRECGRKMMAANRAARTPEQEAKRIEASQRALAARTPEERRAFTAKAWATRRARAALEIDEQ